MNSKKKQTNVRFVKYYKLNPTENSPCPLQGTVSPWKLKETLKHVAEFANCTPPAYHDFDTPKKNFRQTNNFKREVSQHSKSNSDVQLKNNLNIIISEKVRKLSLEKQLIGIRKTYHQNFVTQ